MHIPSPCVAMGSVPSRFAANHSDVGLASQTNSDGRQSLMLCSCGGSNCITIRRKWTSESRIDNYKSSKLLIPYQPQNNRVCYDIPGEEHHIQSNTSSLSSNRSLCEPGCAWMGTSKKTLHRAECDTLENTTSANKLSLSRYAVETSTVPSKLERSLPEWTQAILVEYANLISLVMEKLNEEGVQVADIADLIVKKHGCAAPELYETTDIPKLFKLLKRNGCLTFFDHKLLEEIIHRFEVCQLSLKLFKAKFQTYCRNRIFEIPTLYWTKLGLECESENSQGKVEVIFKIDMHYENLSMKKLKAFGEHAARALGVDKSALHLKSIREGCVRVSYLLSVDDIIIALPQSPDLQRESEDGVFKILSIKTVVHSYSGSLIEHNYNFISKHSNYNFISKRSVTHCAQEDNTTLLTTEIINF